MLAFASLVQEEMKTCRYRLQGDHSVNFPLAYLYFQPDAWTKKGASVRSNSLRIVLNVRQNPPGLAGGYDLPRSSLLPAIQKRGTFPAGPCLWTILRILSWELTRGLQQYAFTIHIAV